MENGRKIYEGEMINVFYHGRGILYYENGKIQFNGSWLYHQMVEGLYYDENELLLYQGTFKSRGLYGNGTSYYPNGNKEYEGYWENNHIQQGRYYSYDNLLVYEGDFNRNEQSQQSRQGTLYYHTGQPMLQFLWNTNGVIMGDCYDMNNQLLNANHDLADFYITVTSTTFSRENAVNATFLHVETFRESTFDISQFARLYILSIRFVSINMLTSLSICDNPLLNTVLFKSNSQLPISPESIIIRNNTNLQKIHFEGNAAVTTSTVIVEGNSFRLSD